MCHSLMRRRTGCHQHHQLQGTTPAPAPAPLRVLIRDLESFGLRQVVEEVPLGSMAGRSGIARGVLQGLQKDAATFCGMVVCFCRHLQWHELANVLFSFQVRG